ncbi:MAG: IspD/TarI family cytidylyltransferase, partial [Solirubrobacteraceae bacterium]
MAAGSGERLGAGRPKAFVALGGRPMLEWSLAAMRAAGIEEIVVALPAGAVTPAGVVVAGEIVPLGPDVLPVEGGAARSQSVRAGLAAAPPGDVVV